MFDLDLKLRPLGNAASYSYPPAPVCGCGGRSAEIVHGREPGFQASTKYVRGAVLMLCRALSQPGLGAIAELDKRQPYPLNSSSEVEPTLRFRRGSRLLYVSIL